MIKDRSAAGAPCSIASVGFGLTAICIGVDHGWVSREAARDRVRTTLNTLLTAPQGSAASGNAGNYGLFYHFLDMSTGTRTWDSELSTIDTGLLLAGIVLSREFFDATDSLETQLRAIADSIYHRMNWNLMRNGNQGILMGWKPGTGFAGYSQWIGYNEAMIMYILAYGSPTHPITDQYGWQAWTSGYNWQTQYGYSYVGFPPLFGHQYSHCWIDFRGIGDAYMQTRGIDYFENSRRATYAQRAYAVANPLGRTGYSDSLWGITASDGPEGYNARGAPPAQNDNGTITPTAPLSSIPFAPEICIPVLWKLWNSYRNGPLWGPYGFRDAFNLTVAPDWYAADYVGIDQGPIIIMIENYRTGSVWHRFMQNADVQRGLERIGFMPVTDVGGGKAHPASFILYQNYPNPFNPATDFGFRISDFGLVSLSVYDGLGRAVAKIVNEELPAGEYRKTWYANGLPSGTYFYELKAGSDIAVKKLLLIK